MAATALLRSIRRRDVFSAHLSYKSLAGNAQPSWGSSYTGQNYASLCRAFGCKPVVNVLGTGLGTNNTSNAIREEREQSKATDTAIVGAQLTRSFRALDVGTSKRLFSTTSGDIKTTKTKEISGGGSAPGGRGEKIKKKLLEYIKTLVAWLFTNLNDLYKKSRDKILDAIVAYVICSVVSGKGIVYDIQTTEGQKLTLHVKQISEEVETLKSKFDDLKLKVKELDESKSKSEFK